MDDIYNKVILSPGLEMLRMMEFYFGSRMRCETDRSCREDSGSLFDSVVSRLLDTCERQAANVQRAQTGFNFHQCKFRVQGIRSS